MKSFCDMSMDELQTERAEWQRVIDEANCWGAGVSAAAEFLRDVDAEIRRRQGATPQCLPNIMDLTAERNKREQPDPQHVRQDDFGRPLYEYALGYRMDGSQWSASVWAYSFEDAENRVRAMRESLEVCGQVYSVVPA